MRQTSAPHEAVGVLLSGGLDSAVLLNHLLSAGNTVQPLYVRSGLVWEPREKVAVERLTKRLSHPRLRPVTTLSLPLRDLYADHWSVTGVDVPAAGTPDEAVHLPGRNALLAVKAAVWCQLHEIRRLTLGALGTSPFADATPGYLRRLGELFLFPDAAPLKIEVPFQDFKKEEVMRLGRNLPLEITFSCLAPIATQHCGVCNKCAERQTAFAAIGVTDRTEYAAPVTAPLT